MFVTTYIKIHEGLDKEWGTAKFGKYLKSDVPKNVKLIIFALV